MPYKYATEPHDYTDYASGAVFYNAPGHPAFPIRLTGEIFQRCLALRASGGATGRPILYDPCCGAAYHLSTLAYLHWHAIGGILCSDIDPRILEVARHNLSLLTLEGLDWRTRLIEQMWVAFGKASHLAAVESAERLRDNLLAFTADHDIPTRVFQADATNPDGVRSGLAGTRVDLVISDIPYGQHSSWQSPDPAAPPPDRPVWRLLEALRPVLAPNAVVAIASDKGQTIAHEAYRRADRFQIGKRQIVLLQPPN